MFNRISWVGEFDSVVQVDVIDRGVPVVRGSSFAPTVRGVFRT